LALFFLFDLLDSKILFSFLLLSTQYVLKSAALFGLGTSNLLFHAFHVLLALENITHFLFHLFFHLHENALSLFTLASHILDFEESLTKAMTEPEEVA
jgi:hypothetical protein